MTAATGTTSPSPLPPPFSARTLVRADSLAPFAIGNQCREREVSPKRTPVLPQAGPLGELEVSLAALRATTSSEFFGLRSAVSSP
eukprot:SAG11_NODE_268_length_11447_cov_3.136135_13_plen_85_part_00